jgi:hypothetical protein
MPCTPAKARHLFKSGKARPKRNKLGLFYFQLCYEQNPANQLLVAGIDPDSKFEGFSVVGTKELREQFGLKKSRSKSHRCFSSHAVDAWVMAASISGAEQLTCGKLWYLVGTRLIRRQLHTLQPAKKGIRKPRGGTRSLCFKRLTQRGKPGDCVVLTSVAFRSWLVREAEQESKVNGAPTLRHA